jgi:uncharacterized membrane protein YhaH (DUF805 family)
MPDQGPGISGERGILPALTATLRARRMNRGAFTMWFVVCAAGIIAGYMLLLGEVFRLLGNQPLSPRWFVWASQLFILAFALIIGRVTVMRLHDMNTFGHWSIVPWLAAAGELLLQPGTGISVEPELYNSIAIADTALIGASILLLVVLVFVPGTKGQNKYGPEPRG